MNNNIANNSMDPEVFEFNPSTATSANNETNVASLPSTVTADVTDVVSFTIDARASFEVFMGKRYDPAEGILVHQEALVPSHPGFDAFAKHVQGKLESGLKERATNIIRGGKNNGNKRALLESPLERYTRLVEETRALQQELRAVEDLDKKGGVSGTTAVDNSQGVFALLTKGSKELEEQLQILASPAAKAASVVANKAAATSIAKAASIVAGISGDKIAGDEKQTSPLAALQSLQRDVIELSRAQLEMQTACAAVQQGVLRVEQKLVRFVSLLTPPPTNS
jgi:hypothetical protein